MEPWLLEEGERIEFEKTGELRGGGFAYRGEPYYAYGDVFARGADGFRGRTLARDVYEGFYILLREGKCVLS